MVPQDVDPSASYFVTLSFLSSAEPARIIQARWDLREDQTSDGHSLELSNLPPAFLDSIRLFNALNADTPVYPFTAALAIGEGHWWSDVYGWLRARAWHSTADVFAKEIISALETWHYFASKLRRIASYSYSLNQQGPERLGKEAIISLLVDMMDDHITAYHGRSSTREILEPTEVAEMAAKLFPSTTRLQAFLSSCFAGAARWILLIPALFDLWRGHRDLMRHIFMNGLNAALPIGNPPRKNLFHFEYPLAKETLDRVGIRDEFRRRMLDQALTDIQQSRFKAANRRLRSARKHSPNSNESFETRWLEAWLTARAAMGLRHRGYAQMKLEEAAAILDQQKAIDRRNHRHPSREIAQLDKLMALTNIGFHARFGEIRAANRLLAELPHPSILWDENHDRRLGLAHLLSRYAEGIRFHNPELQQRALHTAITILVVNPGHDPRLTMPKTPEYRVLLARLLAELGKAHDKHALSLLTQSGGPDGAFDAEALGTVPGARRLYDRLQSSMPDLRRPASPVTSAA